MLLGAFRRVGFATPIFITFSKFKSTSHYRLHSHHSRSQQRSIITMGSSAHLSFIDIGANLLDPMYSGCYHGGERKHDPDLHAVLDRAWSAGVDKIIITAGNLEEARAALALARTHGEQLQLSWSVCRS